MTDAGRFLRKARESLASAEADVRAGRYNSAANRSYYAAFQAAVAALINAGIRPAGNQWQHRFVNSQFSGKLVRRRKLLDSDFPALLDDLFRTRVVGDYEAGDVARRDASRGIRGAGRIVQGVESMMKLTTLRETSAEYEAQVAEGRHLVELAEQRIADIQATVVACHPEARFAVSRLGPKDYRINAFVDRGSFGKLARTLGSISTDILLEDDLWIVVIPHDIRELDAN